MISAHIPLVSSAHVFPHSCNCVKPTSQMKFLRQTNSNLSRTYDRNHPFFAVEVSLQRSVTYNVPSQPTFLPLPGRINITVNVYMRTALRATVSLTLPLCSPSLFFFFLRTSYSEFLSPFLTFSAPAVNRLVSPSFVSLIRPPPSYIIPRAGRGREISTYIHMCETNVGRRCGRHFIKATG